MVAEARTAVDVDAAVRDWLRTVVDVPVFYGVNNDAPFPQIAIMRMGGVDEAARYQIDVWGGTRNEAAQTASDVGTALSDCRHDFDNVRLHAATWQLTRWFPDQESDTPRFIVEAVFTAYANV
jgi:hypothetical protein